MRFLLPLLLLAIPAPACAQAPSPAPGPPTYILGAVEQYYPREHARIAAELAGKEPAEARRLAYAALDRFFRDNIAAILVSPEPKLLDFAARQGRLLREIRDQDVALCATVSERGFFSPEALAAAPSLHLESYGVNLVWTARFSTPFMMQPAALPVPKDVDAWLEAAQRLAPDVPVRAIFEDRARRDAASPDHRCRAAIAMHEAVAGLPPGRGEPVARLLLAMGLNTKH